MKIALALESFDPQRGDREACTFELARHLLRLNHDVHVVAQDFSKAGLEIPIVPHRIRATRSPLRRAATAEAALRSLRADVVHDLGITWYADVFTPPVGSPLGMQQRQLAGAAWWTRPLKRLSLQWSPRARQQAELARRQLDHADSIAIALSEMVAHDYRTIHGLPAERIRVVHPGVDIKKFSPHIRKLRRETTRRKLGIDSKNLLLFSVADECQQGAWSLTFRALRRLAARRVPVRLVIAAPNRAASPQKLADRFGVADRVTVVGAVADRLPYYAAADVLLSPTLYAPFSLAVLEAAACGIPCITTRQNGTADLLTDGGDSCILDRHSAADLAERIELFRDPARCERMGRAARRTAMQYALERSVAKIAQIYDEVVEARTQANAEAPDILTLPRKIRRDSATRRAA
jgi:glycosyltransferase involved in cell wall biosynthesis